MTNPTSGHFPTFRLVISRPRFLLSLLQVWYGRHGWFRWGSDATVVLALVVLIAVMHTAASVFGIFHQLFDLGFFGGG